MAKSIAVILAAGKSTRMNSESPKVLHEVCGRSMLAHVIGACRDADVEEMIVVVGHGKEDVIASFEDFDGVRFVEQTEQKGTGHAVLCCRKELAEATGHVLVIAGDMPLLRRMTLATLLESREASGHAVTLATTILPDPTGYGRIVRDAEGQLEAIVEQKDCTTEQKLIREANPSYYCFDAKHLLDALDQIKPNNAKGEFYITDAVAILRSRGLGVSAIEAVEPEDALGVNSRLDLATVGRCMQDRIQLLLMQEGVTIVDPDNTWIEAGVTVGKDTVIYPFSFLGASASIGEKCRIGPHARIERGETIADGLDVPTIACGASR